MHIDFETNPFKIDKNKQILLFFLGWIGLFAIAIIFSSLFGFFTPSFLTDDQAALFLASDIFFTYINSLTYLTLFLIGGILIWPFLKATFFPALLSGKWWIGLPFTFAILFTSYGLVTIYDALGIQLEDNQNQAAIIRLVKEAPFLSLITFGLLGPIVEEWTYRLGLFQYIKERNKWLAYIITLTIFGLIHFDFTAINFTNELLNLPIYLVAGAWFCFLYDRFGLQVAMSTHIFNNVLSVLSILVSAEVSSSLLQ